jgi:hypothetical protein
MSYKGFGDGGEYRTSHGGKIFLGGGTSRGEMGPIVCEEHPGVF